MTGAKFNFEIPDEPEASQDELDVDGRPRTTAHERKHRADYMRKYRRVKNDPQKKIEAQWSANLSQLPEAERQRLLDAAEEASFLNHLMHLVDKGVSFCGQGIGTVDVDFPDPSAVHEEIQDWTSRGNTFVHSSFPAFMAGLFGDDLSKLDDHEFIQYGLKTHLTFSIWHHFLSNLRKFNRRQSGESIAPVNTSFIQTEGLTQTERQETEQLKLRIRKEVGVE